MPDKTLAEKMYVKNAGTLAVFNCGAELDALRAALPPERMAKAKAEAEAEADASADWLLLCARSRAELEHWLPQAQARLAPGGALWVAYRKGGSKAGSDIQRDDIRRHAQTLGLDSVAIVAIDADWSALRLKQI